jgi:hypothetical protein
MSFPPEFLLIGAQKSGTTSLAFLLDQHPDICVSTPKEADFYTLNWPRGLDWYRDRFATPEDKCLLDASPSYSLAPLLTGEFDVPDAAKLLLDTPARIKSVNPDTRFIYLMREPVARAYSAYWHHVRAGDESLPFRTAVWKHPRYISGSDYAYQIERYLEHFSIDRFLFLLFEDLVRDPTAAAHSCFRFMGVAEEVGSIELLQAKNASFAYNGVGQVVARLAGSGGGLKLLTKSAKKMLPGRIYARAKKLVSKPIPAIDPADQAELAAYFVPKTERLAALTGRSFSRWERTGTVSQGKVDHPRSALP